MHLALLIFGFIILAISLNILTYLYDDLKSLSKEFGLKAWYLFHRKSFFKAIFAVLLYVGLCVATLLGMTVIGYITAMIVNSFLKNFM